MSAIIAGCAGRRPPERVSDSWSSSSVLSKNPGTAVYNLYTLFPQRQRNHRVKKVPFTVA